MSLRFDLLIGGHDLFTLLYLLRKATDERQSKGGVSMIMVA